MGPEITVKEKDWESLRKVSKKYWESILGPSCNTSLSERNKLLINFGY